jgi:hypothetical protein
MHRAHFADDRDPGVSGYDDEDPMSALVPSLME